MSVRFQTREIGSLAKPSWRVKAFAHRPLDEHDLQEARRWGTRLELDPTPLLKLLAQPVFDQTDLQQIDDWACRYAIRLQERAGLDVVYDGEQRRTEMYDHLISHTHGFEARGLVRSFDNKYYAKAAVVQPPALADASTDVAEYQFAAAHTTRQVKVPLTGAYTIMDWSYDEHYRSRPGLGATNPTTTDARRALTHDIATNVLRPLAQALVHAGATWLQIDEPAAATRTDEPDLVVHAFNTALKDLPCRKSLHICYSDYSSLWPAVLELESCHELQPELANRDTHTLGTTEQDRPGYTQTLRLFQQPGSPNIGLGVVDIHTDYVEPAQLVRDRILYATHTLNDPNRVHINPDCGLRTRTWDSAYEKLARMVEGTRQAEATLDGA
jgi:5-methyltetrahydropteroyltriglutamate--homocysteine methyltransferase